MEEFQEIAMLHESDRSPIEMDTAQSLITFSQESVIREAYSPQRRAQSLIQFSEEIAAIRQSHHPEKANINSDEDIIIKEENEDEAVIKMIRKQYFEKEMENITALVCDNNKNGTVEDKINMSVQKKGDGDKIHDGSTVEEGNGTGEQIGDGSPVEEGNGTGGSTEEEGYITGEQIGDGSPVEEGNGTGGSAEEEGDITGVHIGDGSPVEEGDITGEQIGDGSPVEEGNGTVEEIGHGINTETSTDDDQEGEQLEFEDKESAIYW